MVIVAKTQDSTSKEGWMTVTTKKGRRSIPPGRYDPASGKTVSWNVTASEVDVETVETETEALVVQGGQDVHMKKSPTSEQGGCQEVSQGTQKSFQDFK
jgi:hypothetical protein